MSEHYDFHYQPTGSGAISGQQVLQQTEDAINELGDYVNDNVGGAMDVAQQALETAQNAEQDAQTALDTANSFSSAIQSAQQDASTALSTAQTAQTTASNANNTAIQAQQDASSAVTTANNASGQVSTLSGTVTALGQRVTTAEGNIGQNTSDITALTTRVGTAESNITTLQNDVTIAQGNASSAMATAGTVKQQAFVFRYSSTALVASSTNSNALLDNTDNLKVGDKVIDSNGVLFSITAIDTANSTFTIGTALVDLAQDSDVVHKSGDETVGGNKTFTNNISLRSLSAEYGVTSGGMQISFSDKNNVLLSKIIQGCYSSGLSYTRFHIYGKNSNNQAVENSIDYAFWNNTSKAYFRSNIDNFIYLGTENSKWAGVYATNYYYGSNNVEFSTKFVTTDTAQTISESKTFTNTIKSQKEIEFTGNRLAYILPGFSASYSGLNLCTYSSSGAVRIGIWKVDDNDNTKHVLNDSLGYLSVSAGSSNSVNIVHLIPKNASKAKLGDSTNKWHEINGVEPSSLSLPSDRSARIDISSYFIYTGNNATNDYSVLANGYIFLKLNNINQITCYSTDSSSITNYAQTYTRPSDGVLYITFPVRKNDNFRTIWNTGSSVSVESVYFIPYQGNV